MSEEKECNVITLIDTLLSVKYQRETTEHVPSVVKTIRQHIALKGISEDSEKARADVWTLFLRLDKVDAKQYIHLCESGPCKQYEKIRKDSHRTFANDKHFQATVSEAALVRLLNSFVLKHEGTFSYLQGMNTLAGVLLLCLPEPQAFSAFDTLVTTHLPTYWQDNHVGVTAGCKLVNDVVALAHPTLSQHLAASGMHELPYAFASISTLSAAAKPLAEVIKLWDFLLTFGPCWHVLAVAAQVILAADRLLAEKQPNVVLDQRHWPDLVADRIVSTALSLYKLLTPQLRNHIRLHASSLQVAREVAQRR